MLSLPNSLQVLLDRFDMSTFDAPQGRARIRLTVVDEAQWDVLVNGGVRVAAADARVAADATLSADRATWDQMAEDLRGGMDAYRAGRLVIRHNLHVGVGFLAATSGATGPQRLRFQHVETASGTLSILSAGTGEPVVMIHGLGATKGSFLPTVAALAGSFRTIALDLPGFGDSVKPLGAAYHAPFFARAVVDLMNALALPRAHVIGNSMGGRVALELGLRHAERVRRLALLSPSLAWRRERPWAPVVRLLRPELGLLQITPRWLVEAIVHRTIPGADSNWVRAGVDEFLRAYLTPRGRAAFYAAARQIYLEEPHGAKGFWTRLATLEPASLFIWGKRDSLVPIGFAKHVKDTLPAARHLELDCGHVPQLERPAETHAAIAAFFKEGARP
ncbi:MAG TPA: alpha/beta fold hydrolase [Candidatus Margulisiibacteriota bacterium]|nr:alpha/beta fold hydrolase [Candidatus Margulisiibacteriota bacterium]